MSSRAGRDRGPLRMDPWRRPRRLPRRFLMACVGGYRLLLKPWLGSACRFEPTCSAYALEALERHGAVTGLALTGWRVLRCQPWCAGGCDPVPPDRHRGATGLFSRLLALTPAAPCRRGRPYGRFDD